MKLKSIISASVAALLLAVSCVNEKSETLNPEIPSDKSVITASFPTVADSKVSMEETEGGLDLKWKDTDILTVVGETTEKYTIASVSEDGKTATFTGNPVEGDTFKVILSELGEDYLTRNYTADSRPDNGSDMSAKLPYDAVLENVKDYTNVSFTEEWAAANGATFSQTGCVMLHIQLPVGCSKVNYAKLVVNDNVFGTTNDSESEKSFYRVVRFNTSQNADTDGAIKAYFATPMYGDIVSSASKVKVVLECSSNQYIKQLDLGSDFNVTPGKRNILKVNKDKWDTYTKIGWFNQQSYWTAPYCNITHYDHGPAHLIDGKKVVTVTKNEETGETIQDKTTHTMWHTPWREIHVRLDDTFDGWATIGTNYGRSPMTGIINLGERGLGYPMHSLLLTRRNDGDSGIDRTKYVEIYVSDDTSNDSDLGEDHLSQSLDKGITNDKISGYWAKWNAKKWMKVGEVNNNFGKNNDTSISLHGLDFKYVKLVVLSDEDKPVLALSELEFKNYGK